MRACVPPARTKVVHCGTVPAGVLTERCRMARTAHMRATGVSGVLDDPAPRLALDPVAGPDREAFVAVLGEVAALARLGLVVEELAHPPERARGVGATI